MATRNPLKPVKKSVARRLAHFFHRNGYVRNKNAQRAEQEGAQRYKKGDEVRLSTRSQEELEEMQELLKQAGFTAGRSFVKGYQFCQPVYGRKAVARFLEMVEPFKKP
ncbi:MAG: hypothetical protein EA401_12115 [Planctomycetota bacterium]|nr:MAG: hypothetical protein EA401_12115 [Planctomycetota bacterium]